MSKNNSEQKPLYEFIQEWLRENNTTWDWLVKTSKAPGGVGTRLKNGSMPEPPTIRKLADAMRVPRGRLFLLAGYLKEEDLQITQLGLSAQEEALVALARALPAERRRLWTAVGESMLEPASPQSRHGASDAA